MGTRLWGDQSDGAHADRPWDCCDEVLPLYIDLDEQARRFQDRVNDPAKNYKITPEDWRNRDKAPQYLEAMNEMLERTDSPYAPWYIVATNQKKNARLQVLDHFIDHLKSALKNHKKTSKKNGKS